MKRLAVILWLFFCVTVARGQATELVLGDPSSDEINVSPDHILVKHTSYILSFNKTCNSTRRNRCPGTRSGFRQQIKGISLRWSNFGGH